MKIRNKKGFGLVMAIMIVTILTIMAVGFVQITGHSSRTVQRNINSLQVYWAAESASNYNVHWWINQPREVRVNFPYTYTSLDTRAVYNDTDGLVVTSDKFPGAEGTVAPISGTEDLYLHMSSLTEGNTGNVNPELDNFGDYKLYTVRYKGPRAGVPSNDQAVWVLDSYAWNPNTGEIANIVMSNVWNYIVDSEGPWDHSEVINTTNMGLTGFKGVKGRFNRQDIRYGPCYFGDIVHFDYTTSNDKRGPTFYGLVSSASDDLSSYNNGSSFSTDLSSLYSHGLYLNKFRTEALGVEQCITSLKGGYAAQVTPENLDNVVWTWSEIEKYGEENNIWFPKMDSLKIPVGKSIKAVLNTVDGPDGKPVTTAKIYTAAPTNNPNQNPSWTDIRLTLPIGEGGYSGIAVPQEYGTVHIEGKSAKDFTLATQRSPVYIENDFYNYELEGENAYEEGTKLWLEAQPTLQTEDPWDNPDNLLTKLHTTFDNKHPAGHLAIIAAVDVGPDDYEKGWSPIFINDAAGLIYTTAAMMTTCGEVSSKGTSANNDFTHYNIGPVMVLDQQEIMSGPADTASKYRKVYIQDKRYELDPTGTEDPEPLPPMCGYGPDAFPGGSLVNLNPSHTWTKIDLGTTDNWKNVVWRNGQPNF